MPSTFSELYSDFQDAVKIYTEKLDVTKYSFMRKLTRGVQLFQRETLYVESIVNITPTSNVFLSPQDMLVIKEVRDEDGYPMLPQQLKQQYRTADHWEAGIQEVPTNYDMKMWGTTVEDRTTLWTIWQGQFIFYPEYTKDLIQVYYCPDMHAISGNSFQWASWYPHETNFEPNFSSAQLNPSLDEYEEAFLAYAIAQYIKSQGNANYRVYEDQFLAEIERAKHNKPVYFTEGVVSYIMAPWA
jgi:hypothetical protein